MYTGSSRRVFSGRRHGGKRFENIRALVVEAVLSRRTARTGYHHCIILVESNIAKGGVRGGGSRIQIFEQGGGALVFVPRICLGKRCCCCFSYFCVLVYLCTCVFSYMANKAININSIYLYLLVYTLDYIYIYILQYKYIYGSRRGLMRKGERVL